MFIQTETTSNPETLRFLPGREVLGADSVTFADQEAAARSPLAARLFDIRGVARVSLGLDFVTVTKDAAADWQLLKPALFGVIMEHFLTGRPVLHGAEAAGDDAALIAEIEELVESRIRPGIRDEGGDLRLVGYRDGLVTLDLDDAGLQTPAFSLKIRAENTLRYYVPEVTRVEFANSRRDTEQHEARAGLDLNDPETVAVAELLDAQVNPAIAAHGGWISLLEVKDHTAYVRLEGGCQGCGMADVTLKQGVESLIREEVPSIVAVLDTTDHASGENPYFEPGKTGYSPF